MYTVPDQDRDRHWEMMGFYIAQCTVHPTQGQGQGQEQGSIVSIVPIPVPAPCCVYEPLRLDFFVNILRK